MRSLSTTLSIILFVFVSKVFAQDIFFSQYISNPMYLNPALAGALTKDRIVLNYRDQWPGLTSFSKTTAISYDGYSYRLNSGFGAQFIHDKLSGGALSSSNFLLNYSYRVALNSDWNLGMGTKIRVNQKRLDASRLVFEDEIDPRYGLSDKQTSEQIQSNSYFSKNASIGVVLNGTNQSIGFVIDNLLPEEELFMENRSLTSKRYTLHAAQQFSLKEDATAPIDFVAQVFYSKQGAFNITSLGGQFHVGLFTAGMLYRLDNACVVLLGAKFHDVKVGYSYDHYTESKLGGMNKAHELSLTIQLNKKEPALKKKKIAKKPKCPTFYEDLL